MDLSNTPPNVLIAEYTEGRFTHPIIWRYRWPIDAIYMPVHLIAGEGGISTDNVSIGVWVNGIAMYFEDFRLAYELFKIGRR